MAKKAKIETNKRRAAAKERYRTLRDELRKASKDTSQPLEVRMAAGQKLASLPRSSASTRVRNRCALTGRPRGYIRKFGLSRIAFRELALRGEIPGVIKSSW